MGSYEKSRRLSCIIIDIFDLNSRKITCSGIVFNFNNIQRWVLKVITNTMKIGNCCDFGLWLGMWQRRIRRLCARNLKCMRYIYSAARTNW